MGQQSCKYPSQTITPKNTNRSLHGTDTHNFSKKYSALTAEFILFLLDLGGQFPKKK